MDGKQISRRDFLKLLGISPLVMGIPELGRVAGRVPGVDRSAERPNILMLVLDTLSANHISLYGYRRQTMPNLEKIARRATVYHRHYAAGNFTSPGTASLMCGVYPWRHRALSLRARTNEEYSHKNIFSLLSANYHTFAYTHNPLVYILFDRYRECIDRLTPISDLCLYAETQTDRLFERDYALAYYAEIIMQRKSLDPPGQLFAGFANRLSRSVHKKLLKRIYEDRFPRGVPGYSDEGPPEFLYFTLEQVIDWLQGQLLTRPQPYFGYIHLLPPHAPYTTRREFYNKFADGWSPQPKPEHAFTQGRSQRLLDQQRRFYDEAIAYVDAELGRFYEFMDRSGVLDHTYVIITSDHGEMFERGIFRHVTPVLYEPLLRIPLLILSPGQASRADVYSPTSCVDILPTLARIAGETKPDWNEGQVLPFFAHRESPSQRSIFALEAKQNPSDSPLFNYSAALIKDRYKLIRYSGYVRSTTKYELYDLIDDPEELTDLYRPNWRQAVKLRQELDAKIVEVNRPYRE